MAQPQTRRYYALPANNLGATSPSSHASPMSEHQNGGSAAGGAASDRRSNLALRELIDEMMMSIRTAAQGHLWTSDERAQYERELQMIMTRVRSEAVGDKKPARLGAN